MDGGLKIGELARRTGVTAKAIRFYERKGILPQAERAPNGYRLYDGEAVGMLHFVKQASGLGLTLAEIKEIVAIRQGGRPPCTHVHQLLRVKASARETYQRSYGGPPPPLQGRFWQQKGPVSNVSGPQKPPKGVV